MIMKYSSHKRQCIFCKPFQIQEKNKKQHCNTASGFLSLTKKMVSVSALHTHSLVVGVRTTVACSMFLKVDLQGLRCGHVLHASGAEETLPQTMNHSQFPPHLKTLQGRVLGTGVNIPEPVKRPDVRNYTGSYFFMRVKTETLQRLVEF